MAVMGGTGMRDGNSWKCEYDGKKPIGDDECNE